MPTGPGIAIGVCFILLLLLWALVVYRLVDGRRVNRIWRSLEVESDGVTFSKDMVMGLPPVAQRYFLHAISEGTLLASSAQFCISGSIKAQRDSKSTWMRMKATQILAPKRGFVWKASIRKGPISFSEVDHYSEGDGRVVFRAFRLLPIASAVGTDGLRSTLGRLVMDSVLLPSGLLPQKGVKWKAIDEDHVNVTCTVDGEEVTLNLKIDSTGRILEAIMLRWGDFTDDGNYDYIPFGMAIEGERRFNGYALPSSISSGWWYGTDKYVESMRLTIEEAQFK